MPAPGILDAHVHLYGPEASADPKGWGLARGEHHWVACVAPEGRRSIQGWSNPVLLIQHMDRAGIEACVLQGWYWQRQATCELQNGWYLDWSRRFPGRFIPFATVQPADGPAALESLERSLDAGMKGIGELLPQAQGYPLDHPVFQGVMALAAARGLPVTLHATDPEKGPAAGPPTPLGPLVDLARSFPRASVILAHYGGGIAFRGMPDGKPVPQNLFFDTAASPLLYDGNVYARSVDRVGEYRLLYGSDYPLLVRPRKMGEPGFEPALQEIADAPLTKEARALLLGGNIRRLIARGLAPGGEQV